jgi:phage terminase small subunit
MGKTRLTMKAEKFAIEWLKTGNGTAAYKHAYDTSRMRLGTINDKASLLLKHPDVAAFIAAQREKINENALFGVMDVMRAWVDIATADPNEIVSNRLLCCRHCYGKNHAYQWTDAKEFADATADAIDANLTRRRGKLEARDMPNDEGGYGFKFNERPVPGCPKCHGEGVADVFIADTRYLTGKARALYAGMKETKNGREVILRDQDGALMNIAKALGMMTERVKLVPPGEKTNADAVPLDTNEAARVYQAMMKGDPT